MTGDDMSKKYIAIKLKEYREKRGITVNEVATRYNKSIKTIYSWESGQAQPDAEILIDMCFWYGIENLEILSEGHETLTSQKNYYLEETEIETIKKYRMLDTHGKKVVDTVLDIEYERVQENETRKRHERRVMVHRSIPKSLQISSAGTGAYIDDSSYTKIDIPDIPETKDATLAVEIRGDSMEPKYRDGDTVLIAHQPTIEVGEIGIFVLNGEGYIKQWGGDCLISLNPKYKPIKIKEHDTLNVSGKVIYKL